MKQRMGVFVALMAALLVAAFGFAGPASASNEAGSSANKVQSLQKKVKNLQKKVKRATKKSKATCKKVRRAKGKKATRKAKKRCAASKKRVKKLKRNLKSARKSLKKERAKPATANFDVCQHGCAYRTVQDGVNAAGKWQFNNPKGSATVRIQPGTYVEGVYMHGSNPKHRFDDLTVMGVTADKKPLADASQVIFEGNNAKTIKKGNDPAWQPSDAETVPAQNAIEARNVQGLVMKNMWARHYLNNTFFVWASTNPAFNERCSGYVMDNLITSDTRSYGFFARNCFGGEITNSEGWNHGDSAVYIGETPCDDPNWTNRGANPKPCQADPDWTVIDNVKSHQNVLGYSGTNSKYVEIKNSAFYNNGAGIVPNTLDSEKFEPAGWMNIHDNDIFWNNYNYFSTGSEFQTVSDGLGEVLGQTVNYPMGVGVVLFGTDGIEVKNNRIFGHEKWGAMTFSAPVANLPGVAEVEANKGDDAKNMNNRFIDNQMGRNGVDANQVDFLNHNTGGGNCFIGNTASPAVTYVLGNGNVPQAQLYPSACPAKPVLNKDVRSFDATAGVQVNLADELDRDTILGYAASAPARDQECSWDIK
ncbi:MAG: hypothetical protein M3Y23_04105, partial [Actinomycetota bacterium]|nr:hypothetical protein [Actinomycetota bacterium]